MSNTLLMEMSMSAIPYPMDPLGSSFGPCFELVVKPGILGSSTAYRFTPYWYDGGYCKVMDWGDGSSEDATTSGTELIHTYAAAGTYTIRIKADCFRCIFGHNGIAAQLVYNANGNWDALGNIIAGDYMFEGCTNALFNFSELPEGLTSASYMFKDCTKATLHLTRLPAGLASLLTSMFENALLAVIDLDDLTANAPEGGWTGVRNIMRMFYNAGSGNSPGTVTGSRSAFLAKFPSGVLGGRTFQGTNTTE